MEKKITQQLCQNSIFEGLTHAQIDSILPCIMRDVKIYSSQECIYRKGDEVQNPGVVLEGALEVCDETADGKRTPVSSIQENELFGEVVTFSTDSAVPHQIVANRTTRVMFLSGDFFLKPCTKECDSKEAHQEIVKNMLRLLSDRTLFLNKKIAYLSAPDLKTKIAMYLAELCETTRSTSFNMPLNRDRLAEFFSVARPSLSRELINLKKMGVIDFHRSSVEILDMDALYALARGE